MSELFRTFISLPVPDGVKGEIRRMQNRLRAELPEDALRWTRPEQIHLTLKFLGNVTPEKCDELSDALRESCKGISPFQLRAEGVGFFPERGNPRVVWVGVRDANEQLLRLQSKVESVAKDIAGGVAEERFTGHLTIARAKNLRPPEARRLIEFARNLNETDFGEWRVEQLDLMRSELGPQGSNHTCIAAIQFER